MAGLAIPPLNKPEQTKLVGSEEATCSLRSNDISSTHAFPLSRSRKPDGSNQSGWMRGISSIGSTNPVTALAFVEPLNILLAGSAPSLIATSPRQPRRKWNVFVRERVHRILVGTGTKDEGSGAWSWRVLVLGGKEAVLLSLTSPGAAEEDGP